MRDDLARWWSLRTAVPWRDLAPLDVPPVAGRSEGALRYARSAVDPSRAARLADALIQVRAATGPLTFAVLAGWQATVLGVPEVPFRRGIAYAGRERYGLEPDTATRFESCLAEAGDPELPVASRAARIYLDVAFVHPFADGNARAALLALTFVLLRARIELDTVDPIVLVRRRPDGAADLTRLVQVLIGRARRRAGRSAVAGAGERAGRGRADQDAAGDDGGGGRADLPPERADGGQAAVAE